MKLSLKFFPFFLSFSLLFESWCSGSADATLLDGTLYIYDKDSANLKKIIADILTLQRSLLIAPSLDVLPNEAIEKGFLLIRMNEAYIEQLLFKKQGKMVCLYSDQVLAGYILLTDISVFQALYANPFKGRLEYLQEENLIGKDVAYIEQIGVSHAFARQGVGTKLIEACKHCSPAGVVADVFIEPVQNFASLAFFTKMGFLPVGILHMEASAHLEAHKTRVFFWAPFLRLSRY